MYPFFLLCAASVLVTGAAWALEKIMYRIPFIKNYIEKEN